MMEVDAPPAKRLRLETKPLTPLGLTLAARSVLQAKVELPTAPSPGSLSGCRVAIQVHDGGDSSSAYVASGSQLCRVSIPPQHQSPVTLGKSCMLLPRAAEGCVTSDLPGVLHEGEIQSIALATSSGLGDVLASVDSCGRGILSWLSGSASQDVQAPASRVVQLHPKTNTRESGWAGVSVVLDPLGSGSSTAWVACARQLARDVTVFDQDGHCLRTFHTLQCPSAVAFVPMVEQAASTQTLALAEENLVSLWDLRAGEQGGLIQRFAATPAGSPTHCLAWCPAAAGGLLGITGDDRSVQLFDPRKWRARAKWAGCVKHSARHLSFSVANPAYCFVAGLDYEVVCGRWDGRGGATTSGNAGGGAGHAHGRAVGPNGHQTAAAGHPAARTAATLAGDDDQPGSGGGHAVGLSFRGDSRWLGVTRAPATDLIAAFSQLGNLYLAEFTGISPAVVAAVTVGEHGTGELGRGEGQPATLTSLLPVPPVTEVLKGAM